MPGFAAGASVAKVLSFLSVFPRIDVNGHHIGLDAAVSRPGGTDILDGNAQTSRDASTAARMKSAKSGCGANGLDFSSG